MQPGGLRKRNLSRGAVGPNSWVRGGSGKIQTSSFVRHSVLKTIILPRQARDKHRESTQKRDVFTQLPNGSVYDSTRYASPYAVLLAPMDDADWATVHDPPSLVFRSMKDRFDQDRLGTSKTHHGAMPGDDSQACLKYRRETYSKFRWYTGPAGSDRNTAVPARMKTVSFNHNHSTRLIDVVISQVPECIQHQGQTNEQTQIQIELCFEILPFLFSPDERITSCSLAWSCLVLPCLVLSCPVLSCPVLSCRVFLSSCCRTHSLAVCRQATATPPQPSTLPQRDNACNSCTNGLECHSRWSCSTVSW